MQEFVLSDIADASFGSKRYVYVAPSRDRVNHVEIRLTPAEFSRRGHPGSLWADLDGGDPEETTGGD